MLVLTATATMPIEGTRTLGSKKTQRTTKRTLKDKEATAQRLKQELEADLAYTASQVRHIPPSPSGSSRNPNHVLAFNFVNNHFLNREEHDVAVAIVEEWKPQPLEGANLERCREGQH